MSCRPVQESYGQPGPQGRSTDAIVFGLRLGAKALHQHYHYHYYALEQKHYYHHYYAIVFGLLALPLPLLPLLLLLLLSLIRSHLGCNSTIWLVRFHHLAATVTFTPRFVPWI